MIGIIDAKGQVVDISIYLQKAELSKLLCERRSLDASALQEEATADQKFSKLYFTLGVFYNSKRSKSVCQVMICDPVVARILLSVKS